MRKKSQTRTEQPPMKRILTSVFVASAFCVTAFASEPTVLVHTKLFEITSNNRLTITELPKDVAGILKKKGVDVLTAPEIKTRSGESKKISVTRSFAIANKGKFQTGITLSVRPTVDGARFRYSVDFDSTAFDGFASDPSKTPIFTIRKITDMSGECDGGKEVWLDLGERLDEQMVKETGKPETRVNQTIHVRLIAVISFNKA
jgi:hypothetical protein